MPGWDDLPILIEFEGIQLIEEGVDPAAANAAMETARKRAAEGADEKQIWSAFANLPRRKDFGFEEPDDLQGIRAKRNGHGKKSKLNLSDEALLDKMHGAWLGRCAGCALGKPVEQFMGKRNGIVSWLRQKKYLTAISPSEWPLKDYYPQHSPAEEETGPVGCYPSTREQIAYMETDDDIRYTVLGQRVLMDHGADFTSSNVAAAWLRHLPYKLVCTAETQAYRNIVIACDQFRRRKSGDWDDRTDWHWVTHHYNPFREWIGAQIRIDSYGYAAPCNPELAAEFAWRDARISHVKNGIYGAMFCAAMIAASFATDDVMQIIEAGLAEIPSTSRLYEEMRHTIAICVKYANRFENFERVIEEIYTLLGHYHQVHTNNNAALCVMALLLGGGDFHKGITLAVMGGWDTDCNGATVGSIVGAICGGKKVPQHWSGRLNDTLNSAIIDYHPIKISECARRSFDIAKKILSTTGVSPVSAK